MSETFGLINDGYNCERFLRGVPRLYPDVRLTVRIMAPGDRAQWSADVSRAADDERSSVTAKWLAGRIIKWSLPVKPTPENVSRLVPALYDKVFSLIFGESAGDALPETGEVPENDPQADAGNLPRA